MYKSMKMYLKNKLTDSEELSKIRGKLHKFLGLNPEVDQYLCDEVSRKTYLGFLIGLIFGMVFTLVILIFAFWIQLDIWHAQGYLHLPGSIFWK